MCQGRPLRPATRGRSKHLLGSKGLHLVIVLQFLSCPEIWIRDNAKKHRTPRGFRCTLYIRCEMSENRWFLLIIKEEEGQWYLFPVSSHGWVSPSWCALVWLCFCTWVASSPSQAGVSMNAVFISWTDHKKKTQQWSSCPIIPWPTRAICQLSGSRKGIMNPGALLIAPVPF